MLRWEAKHHSPTRKNSEKHLGNWGSVDDCPNPHSSELRQGIHIVYCRKGIAGPLYQLVAEDGKEHPITLHFPRAGWRGNEILGDGIGVSCSGVVPEQVGTLRRLIGTESLPRPRHSQMDLGHQKYGELAIFRMELFSTLSATKSPSSTARVDRTIDGGVEKNRTARIFTLLKSYRIQSCYSVYLTSHEI